MHVIQYNMFYLAGYLFTYNDLAIIHSIFQLYSAWGYDFIYTYTDPIFIQYTFLFYSAGSYEFGYTDLALLTTAVLVINFPRNQQATQGTYIY